MVNKKAALRVSHELNLYLRYLHLDQYLSKFSLPSFWRYGTNKIEVHAKQIKGKSRSKPKLSKCDKVQ